VALEPEAIARSCAELVRVPSVTGDERGVLERLGELAAGLGLEPRLHRHDLAAVRAHPAHPGEEAARDELLTLTVTAGAGPRRIALCGHVDVVDPGTVPWTHGPWSGTVEGGRVAGRGSADMKGGVAAALHALAAWAAAGEGAEVVLVAVASEEDGGLGAFAFLQDDARFDACLIPEPTGFDVVCAQAGALTFSGTVPGVAAHAAQRLSGVSAIDRYVGVHAALAALERSMNAAVADPLMAALELPYPLSVGRLEAGTWSSSVPDRLTFEGRVGVPVGDDPAQVRAAVARAVADACPEATLAWDGGQFASARTDHDGPVAQAALAAVADVLGRPGRPTGVPWGADMRLWSAAGVPTVMVGPEGITRAHAVDEWVAVDDLHATARVLLRTVQLLADACT
jgi:acetylornithine deacetylase